MSDVLQSDEILIKQAEQFIKEKNYAALITLGLTNKDAVTAQVAEVKKEIPVIKNDLHAPHFYLIVAYAVANFLCFYYKIELPVVPNASIAALLGGLLTSNHFKTNK